MMIYASKMINLMQTSSWHKDEYNYDCAMRSPRSEWIFALYYPQAVTPEMGPTCILPQYCKLQYIYMTNWFLSFP